MRRVPPVVVLAACVACHSGAGAAPGLSTVHDSAGVSIATGPAVDSAIPWTVTEVRRIGGADTGALSFTDPGIATDGSARMFVLDRRATRVHVIDTMGNVIRTVGAKGSGPGEMQFPGMLAASGDARFAVLDFEKSALLRWNSEGVVMPELRIDFGKRGHMYGPMAVAGDTTAFEVYRGDSGTVTLSVVLTSPRDTVVIDSMQTPGQKMVMFKCVGLNMAPLLTGQLAWDMHDGIVATTNQSDYIVQVWREKRLVRSVRRAVPSVATTSADAERLYPEGMKVSFGNGRDCVTPATEVAEKAGIAKTVPAIKAVRIGPDGSLWVQRYTFDAEPPRTDVFDPAGQYLGTLAGKPVPAGFLANDLVVFPVEDATTGEKVVGIYRIGRPKR